MKAVRSGERTGACGGGWGRQEAKSVLAWKFRMSLFDPFVIKTQENNEIVVPNRVMASQAIIKSA